MIIRVKNSKPGCCQFINYKGQEVPCVFADERNLCRKCVCSAFSKDPRDARVSKKLTEHED